MYYFLRAWQVSVGIGIMMRKIKRPELRCHQSRLFPEPPRRRHLSLSVALNLFLKFLFTRYEPFHIEALWRWSPNGSSPATQDPGFATAVSQE